MKTKRKGNDVLISQTPQCHPVPPENSVVLVIQRLMETPRFDERGDNLGPISHGLSAVRKCDERHEGAYDFVSPPPPRDSRIKR